jgi:hypothetical protein
VQVQPNNATSNQWVISFFCCFSFFVVFLGNKPGACFAGMQRGNAASAVHCSAALAVLPSLSPLLLVLLLAILAAAI